MSRRTLTLLLVLFLIPAVTAGSEADPELVDPAGDATATAGQCMVGETAANEAICNSDISIGAANPSAKADILSVWASDINETHYGIYVNTTAQGDANTAIALGFKVMRTEHSLPGGMDNQTFSVTVTGQTVAAGAPANTTAARNATDGSIMEIIFTRADTGAVGGDAIQNITLTVTDKETRTGDPAAPTTREDTTTDSTEGDSRPYNLTRPAKQGNITLTLTSGSLTQTINGTTNVTALTNGTVMLEQAVNGTADITYTFTATNHGLDPDTLFFSILDASGLAAKGINATITPATAALAPGETTTVTMDLALTATPSGTHSVYAQASTTLGGYAFTTTTITVPAQPPPPTPTPTPTPTPQEETRSPAVAGLGFLTPAAEAMGLIGPFGDYAELVLLAIILLILILIVFLIIALATRGAVRIRIEPRKMVVAPGATAEFRVEIKNRKGSEVDALASFESNPEWATSLSFSGHELVPGADAAMHLGGKKDQDSVRHGVLKVTAPEAADDKEAERVTIAVAPLRDDGSARKPLRSRIRVQAHSDAPAHGVRLAGVEHDPSHPEAGQVVETTARIENDSEDEVRRLRVVLNVDGDDLQEQPLTLPPQQARAVVFTWQVPAGSSKVRVRIYADE